ncbi:hypothetical protein Pla52n_09250 [Stieleria varia]|uniref:Uncharacterized protein n=1 Tax=Stieleria varia TaxID=2528005 RepID=A0A5C6B8D6_9BACT|nr:hypothetical protein Pla52n_09250 [Stieleria varia]
MTVRFQARTWERAFCGVAISEKCRKSSACRIDNSAPLVAC